MHKYPALNMQSRRMIMKTLMSALVTMAVLGGIAAPGSAAPRNPERSANPYYVAQPNYHLREQQVCREDAFEADPSGQYAGYPCWARQAFSPRR
jgi:hypothetical protein